MAKGNKYNMGTSPNCLKCKARVGTRFHCLWECAIIQSIWKEVCANISTAIGHQVTENTLMSYSLMFKENKNKNCISIALTSHDFCVAFVSPGKDL
uniref:Uncharacterized protein n=1 Tax=Oreochromis aureus TaxID=47969 RepID=A0AAZ1XH58_OREAU